MGFEMLRKYQGNTIFLTLNEITANKNLIKNNGFENKFKTIVVLTIAPMSSQPCSKQPNVVCRPNHLIL